MRRAPIAGGLFTLAVCAFGGSAISPETLLNLEGSRTDPFASSAKARVFLFVRTDCPITNRYAPELQRIAKEFAGRGVDFWLIYADPAETPGGIRKQFADYHLPGTPLRDRGHQLVHRARATVAPEAAVFDSAGRLIYHGRIDDLWVSPGKARPAPLVHDLETAVSAVLAGKRVPEAERQAVGCSLADVQ